MIKTRVQIVQAVQSLASLCSVQIVFGILFAAAVYGHPGATDKDGCHKVSKDYKYIGSTKALKAGTTHCQAGLGKMLLGKELLEDPYDAAEEVQGKVKSKK